MMPYTTKRIGKRNLDDESHYNYMAYKRYKNVEKNLYDAYSNNDLLEYIRRFREFGHDSEEIEICVSITIDGKLPEEYEERGLLD
jgi:hypothetical protein|tara:strand:+ start:767 stop:1021 length:255 start_codon:yes stop_codon:yes gene_type:complete